MSSPNDGGRAFPSAGSPVADPELGMTLRDYFAAQAMESLLGPIIARQDIDPDFNFVAHQAYSLADEMLKRSAAPADA